MLIAFRLMGSATSARETTMIIFTLICMAWIIVCFAAGAETRYQNALIIAAYFFWVASAFVFVIATIGGK